jgi:hypothetical protein
MSTRRRGERGDKIYQPTNWLQAQTHADKLMPTRPIMNIANLDFYFLGGCVLFSAFSAPPRETFQIKIPVSTGNYDKALLNPRSDSYVGSAMVSRST